MPGRDEASDIAASSRLPVEPLGSDDLRDELGGAPDGGRELLVGPVAGGVEVTHEGVSLLTVLGSETLLVSGGVVVWRRASWYAS